MCDHVMSRSWLVLCSWWFVRCRSEPWWNTQRPRRARRTWRYGTLLTVAAGSWHRIRMLHHSHMCPALPRVISRCIVLSGAGRRARGQGHPRRPPHPRAYRRHRHYFRRYYFRPTRADASQALTNTTAHCAPLLLSSLPDAKLISINASSLCRHVGFYFKVLLKPMDTSKAPSNSSNTEEISV